MSRIDFTTTAMPRPDILDRCLKSFSRNLIGIDLRHHDLYINIDPYPYTTNREYVEIVRLQKATIDIAQKYFAKVISNTPKKPNYTKSYKWVFTNAKSEIIFNLEDDWVLTRPVFVKNILRQFLRHRNLNQVALRAYSYIYPTHCSSPSFLHHRLYGTLGRNMVTHENPESQMHKDNTHKYGCFIPNKKNGSLKPTRGYKRMIDKYMQVYPKYRAPKQNIIIKDIGRDWFKSCPYITPIEFYEKEKKKYKKIWEYYQKKGILCKVPPPKVIKKVDFLSWKTDKENNPLKWLINYES